MLALIRTGATSVPRFAVIGCVVSAVWLAAVVSHAQYPPGTEEMYMTTPPPGSDPPPPGDPLPPGDPPPPPGDGGAGDGGAGDEEETFVIGLPYISGTWKKDDPFTTTIYLSNDTKTVREEWWETDVELEFNFEVHEGLEYRSGYYKDLLYFGNITYTYQKVNGSWYMTNISGVDGFTDDKSEETVHKNTNPWIAHISALISVVQNNSYFVKTAANLNPGQEKDCVTDLSSVNTDIGERYHHDGFMWNNWNLITTAMPILLHGFNEVNFRSPEDPNVINVDRTEFWADWVDGQPVQRQRQFEYDR